MTSRNGFGIGNSWKRFRYLGSVNSIGTKVTSHPWSRHTSAIASGTFLVWFV